tara:strand:+ start:80 stop:349 length:270 start_codon:yes stop_codon:yes gene_type:complete
MFLPIKIRMKIASIFQQHGLSGTPTGSGICSRIYHKGVSNNLDYIKRNGLSPEDAAIYCISKTLSENTDCSHEDAFGTLHNFISRQRDR